jgi:hypothetical protein
LSLSEELARAQTALAESNETVRELNSTSDRQTKAIADKDAQLAEWAEKSLAHVDSKTLADELTLCRKQLEEATARERELATQAEQLKFSRTQLAHVRDEHATLRKTLHALEVAHSRSVETVRVLNQKIGAYETQISSLGKQLLHEQKETSELKSIINHGKKSRGSGNSKTRVLSEQKLAQLQLEVLTTVEKIILSEEATESSFTCFMCMQILDAPVTCIPCGHSFCKRCIAKTNRCGRCGPNVAITYYPNDLLDNLTTKFLFRRQALGSLKIISAKMAV